MCNTFLPLTLRTLYVRIQVSQLARHGGSGRVCDVLSRRGKGASEVQAMRCGRIIPRQDALGQACAKVQVSLDPNRCRCKQTRGRLNTTGWAAKGGVGDGRRPRSSQPTQPHQGGKATSAHPGSKGDLRGRPVEGRRLPVPRTRTSYSGAISSMMGDARRDIG